MTAVAARTVDQKKIDLLIEQNGKLHPIEIRKSADPGKQATRHFSVLKPAVEPGQGKDDNPLKVEVGEGAVICP